jgi:hypothetical protein
MFINAIEKASEFTRPIHTITKTYKGTDIIPGAATLFFINDEGYALTCRHVVELLLQGEQINDHYNKFKAEKTQLKTGKNYNRQLRALLLKYNIKNDSTVQIKNSFIDCVDKMSSFSSVVHPHFDIALIKFEGFSKLQCNNFAVFKKDVSKIKQGQFLCRLGYPFPEFTNFNYNKTNDDIEWNSTGQNGSPKFPIEGMITRFLADNNGKFGIELSTPGLRGQSGGPLFDSDGIVYGMQSRTKHLHLGFDIVNKEILLNGKLKKVNNYSFMHLGECISVDIIKDFLNQHKISFQEV